MKLIKTAKKHRDIRSCLPVRPRKGTQYDAHTFCL